MGSYYALKGHPVASQGDHLDWAYSDQMVLEMIRRGEAGPVEQSSAEAKRLKTKGHGTVRLPLKWATAEAARRGARGPNNRTTLMTYY